MTMKLEIPPDVQAGLLAQAQDSGLSLEAYIESVLREKCGIVPVGNRSAADRARAFEQWARSHAHNPPLPEEALRRENLLRTPE